MKLKELPAELLVIKTSNLYDAIFERAKCIHIEGAYYKGQYRTSKNGFLHSTPTSAAGFHEKDEGGFVQISQSLFKLPSLEVNELNVLHRIMEELMQNNPLWFCADKNKSQVINAIRSLEKRGVLSIIKGSKGVYFVNPSYLRRGAPLDICMALLLHIEESRGKNFRWKLSEDDVKPLKRPEKFDTARFDPNGHDFSVVEEPAEPYKLKIAL
jgi:hypothetical protein